jgi:hypothetical protein
MDDDSPLVHVPLLEYALEANELLAKVLRDPPPNANATTNKE